ncbi:secretory lipase [Corynebacterium lactis RW2-5]|uniref:Secretory lipase n=1 Tax=Corynebacterium lactis RW2-5 TaxID=1408189 RepID=A0A0K2H177_9CORY|nr:secretory lipase [Corynebacterium lactis RW2-5]
MAFQKERVGAVEIDEAWVGKVIKKENLDTSRIISAPNGAATMRVTYGARNAHGEPIAVTGLVTLPKGNAPAEGWPVLSWAHGTTGIARQSAPSLAIDTHPDHEAFTMVVETYLQVWLEKGFAVIQPDYEGLGTMGNGTYMDRHSLAASVNDMVRATRDEFSFADTWYNTGWSQGGFAAVAAASAEDVPSGLVKTLAIAPGDTFVPTTEVSSEQAHAMIAGVDEKNLAYSAFVMQGAMNFNATIKADDFLNDAGKSVLDYASGVCLTTFKSENKITGKEILKENPQLEPLLEHLLANSMVNMHPKTPVVIFSSKDDEIINYEQISVAAKQLQANDGTNVTFEVRMGEGHRDMVRRAIKDQTPFVPELQEAPLAGVNNDQS